MPKKTTQNANITMKSVFLREIKEFKLKLTYGGH
jgi:hypothetical protein